MKRNLIFPVLFLFIIVVLGLNELAYNNNVFASSSYPYCQNLSPGKVLPTISCSDQVYVSELIEPPDVCTSYYLTTAYDCVNIEAAGDICSDSTPYAACNDNGSCYGYCWVTDHYIWILD